MKKLLLIALPILFSAMGFAQQTIPVIKGHQVSSADVLHLRHSVNSSVEKTTLTLPPMYLDYSGANFDSNYYVWQYNSLYTATDSFQTNYIAVAIDSFAGYTDPTNVAGSFISYPTMNYSFNIDSIFASFTQENNSGEYDHFIFQVVSTTGGAPAKNSTVLYSHDDSSNVGLSAGNEWLGMGTLVTLFTTPNLPINIGQGVALNFIYKNKSKTDSLGFLAGYVPDPINNANASVTNYKYSYTALTDIVGDSVIKNSALQYSDGTPYFAQNWVLWAYLSNIVSGINNNTQVLDLMTLSPNPANNNGILKYSLKQQANVNIAIYDITGRQVFNLNKGNMPSGTYQENIDASNYVNGMYTIAITANGNRSYTKFIVNR